MKPIKTLLSLLFISLLSSPSWSETMDKLVERNDFFYKQFTDIPYTGKVTGVEQGFFKNGKKDGAWVGYHENGQLKYKGTFNNGKLKGAWVEYYENGQLLSKINYKNGEAEAAWAAYWVNGQLFHKGNLKDGKKEDAWVEYYEDGQLLSKGSYKNGKEEGTWVMYLENGQLSEGKYKNGKEEGTWLEYYENGQLLSKGNYKNGEAEGAWVEYYDDGTLKKKGSYKNGKFASDTPLSMLVMVFNKDCWVEIKDGRGKMVVADLYSSGSKIEQLVVSPIEVLLGRSSGVTKMMFHGETIDLKPHTRKDIARLTLTRR
ncbi:MAG TPA: hypothetical protein DCR48_00150 [Flavobacteriales bacterium]|nr:hypothetical protein [Flavobacteriales bacterium]